VASPTTTSQSASAFAVLAVAGSIALSCDRPAPRAKSVRTEASTARSTVIRYVFVIAMENSDARAIYGNVLEAPYINGALIPRYARSLNFLDELPLDIPSEAHYIWLESGTSTFADHTFTDDDDPSATNSTADTTHLTTQIRDAANGVTWRTYQEGLDTLTGACPIHTSGLYAPKHNPFVFFRDVTGSPPAADNGYCAAHHRPYAAFEKDLSSGDVASYTFITPNLCHDMHGAESCFESSLIRYGDDWLRAELPRIIAFANANGGVIFLEWDEGAASAKIPFIAIGPGVKEGYGGAFRYDHGSILKTIEAVFGLPTIERVANVNDLSDLFRKGQYP
jgi:hypothetical protein